MDETATEGQGLNWIFRWMSKACPHQRHCGVVVAIAPPAVGVCMFV